VNDILEWFPRSVSSDSIVESTYCVDLMRRLPSPLSTKVKGRFCPGKCFVLYYILSFFFFYYFSRIVPPHCPHSSHHGPFDQLIIIFIPTARATKVVLNISLIIPRVHNTSYFEKYTLTKNTIDTSHSNF